MTSQPLLHPEFNVVRKELVLFLDVKLAGSHTALLRILLVLFLDVFRSHYMVDS